MDWLIVIGLPTSSAAWARNLSVESEKDTLCLSPAVDASNDAFGSSCAVVMFKSIENAKLKKLNPTLTSNYSPLLI
uniref:Secreted protein n=1 Tax=Globodera rostochiensis TaxID=31243 RepID=A0A914I6K5_GLORO